MNDELRVSICSPPDRKFLVAEIMLDNEQVAELNQEQNALLLEIYPRRDGQPWIVSYEVLLKALTKAKKRLSEE